MDILNSKSEKNTSSITQVMMKVLLAGFILMAGLILLFGVVLALQPSTNVLLGGSFSWLFAFNTTQTMWYITRSAGIIAYLLLWFSTVWGLALPAKLFDRFLPRASAYDFHQFISLLSIGFIFLHVGVLLLDKYLPFNLAQILVPFLSTYRPVWVGIGVIGFYLTLLVTVTFYIRSRIGMKAFRSIHLFSLLAYLGAVIHGFFAGTDSALTTTTWMYYLTFLVVVFLTIYWLVMAALNKVGMVSQVNSSVTTRQQPDEKRPAPVRSRSSGD